MKKMRKIIEKLVSVFNLFFVIVIFVSGIIFIVLCVFNLKLAKYALVTTMSAFTLLLTFLGIDRLLEKTSKH